MVTLFGAGLLVRLLIAVVILPDGGHRSDLQIVTEWARELAENGPGAFYRPDSGHFADYPPAYLYVLWLTGVAGQAWSSAFGGPDVTPLMLKLPFMLADLGVAAVLFLLTRHLFGRRAGVAAAAIYLFNPAVILISTVWAQNDPIATLAVLVAIHLLVTGRTVAAAAVAVLAMLVKFQYGFAIPIVAIVGLRRYLASSWDGVGSISSDGLRQIGLSIVAGISTLLVVSWPFRLAVFDPGNPAYSLVHRFVGASQAFPGVTQNAFNLWMNPFFDVVIRGSSGLTEGHVVDDTTIAVAIGGLALTWQWVGNLLFIAAVAIALSVLIRRIDGPTIVFVALLIAVAFFALPTRVHERYLYPALALGLPLLAAGTAWRFLYVALSAVAFLNIYWVYSLPMGNAGPGRGILGDTVYSAAGIYGLSAMTVAVMAFLAFRALRPESLPWRHASDSGRSAARASTVARALARRLDDVAIWIRTRRIAPGVEGFLPVLIVLSAVFAMLAARLPAPPDMALWNLDLPKIDAPLAVFFHEALARGTLPLWNDRLGLGFPLYAEGQIGAFYPLNWFIFQAEPAAALAISRTVHLTIVGVGTGLLALRLAGNRTGAVLATAVAILGGAIVTKLEWTNLVAAYAWLPWILLPLARRPAPTRVGLVVAGMLFGLQALAGHPNIWLLTGMSAAVLLVVGRWDRSAFGRVVGFGLIGGAIGSIQLLPTLLLTRLSVRSAGLSPDDVFTSSTTIFDPLSFGFAQAFIRTGGDGWDIYTSWYPDGIFALLEASAFVGLGVLALAAVGAGVARARPWLIMAGVLLAIPVVAAFRPEPWLEIPILNGLRSPVRSYIVVAWILGLLAAIGVGRLGRGRKPRDGGLARTPVARAIIAAGSVAIMYAIVTAGAVALPSLFDALLRTAANDGSADYLANTRAAAAAALTQPFPVLAEIAAGVGVLGLIRIAVRRPQTAAIVRLAVVAMAIAPLLVLSPLANPVRPVRDILPVDSELAVALRARIPSRVLILDPPGFFDGTPDRLAAAGIPDLDMFSSLNLTATDRMAEQAHHGPDADLIRRLVGVDTLVTLGKPCPGTDPVKLQADQAVVCDVPALTEPYWIPASAVRPGPDDLGRAASAITPSDAELDLRAAVDSAVPGEMAEAPDGTLDIRIQAATDGYVWIGRAWWLAWSVTLDGQPVTALRALGGQLVPVGPGAHDLSLRLVPWDALLGLAFAVVVSGLALAWAVRPWARLSLWARLSPWARR